MTLFIDGIAVVTGAASGIGKECALAFAAEGARGVVFADLNYEAASATAKESEAIAIHPNYKTLPVVVNVADITSVEAMVKATLDAFGRIDYNVNSAGVGVQEHLSVEEADPAEMNRFWQVNVMGTFHCVRAVSRAMKSQAVSTTCSRGRIREVGRGVITNLGSCNSLIATPDIVQYTTSKHAVMGMTKNAALDLAKYGIRVNAICPGWVSTPMVDAAIEGNDNLPKMIGSMVPMKRIARPEEIADVVLFMSSPRSSFVTGAGWIVDGGTMLNMQPL